MASTCTTTLKGDIAALKTAQEKLFVLGWSERKYETLILLATMIAIIAGFGGVIDVLYGGIGWISAVSIGIGSFALYKGIESDKSKAFFREQYHKNSVKLAEMEDRYRELTFTPDSAEESDRKWKDLMLELEEQTRPPPPAN